MNSETAESIRNANIEIHRREAEIFDAVHPEIFNAVEQKRIRQDIQDIHTILGMKSQVKALDIGCGTGNLTLKYLKLGYTVTAVDISKEMIEMLKSKILPEDIHRTKLIVDDAEVYLEQEDHDQLWDLISFSAVLHHLPDYTSVLSMALQRLMPGGILYVCHEPLAHDGSRQVKATVRMIKRFVDVLDQCYIYFLKFIVYLRWSIRYRKLFHRIDYSLSDYHLDKGLNVDHIIRKLDNPKTNVILCSKNRSRFSGFLTALDERFEIAEPTSFRFILQRLYEERDPDALPPT